MWLVSVKMKREGSPPLLQRCLCASTPTYASSQVGSPYASTSYGQRLLLQGSHHHMGIHLQPEQRHLSKPSLDLARSLPQLFIVQVEAHPEGHPHAGLSVPGMGTSSSPKASLFDAPASAHGCSASGTSFSSRFFIPCLSITQGALSCW